MPDARLRLATLLLLFGGLALLSSSALQGFFLFEGILALFPPPEWEYFFVGVMLFWGGLAVLILGTGVLFWAFARRSD